MPAVNTDLEATKISIVARPLIHRVDERTTVRATRRKACRPSEALRPAKPTRSPRTSIPRRSTTPQIKRRPTPPDLFGMAATLPSVADRTNRSGGGGLPRWSAEGRSGLLVRHEEPLQIAVLDIRLHTLHLVT